MTTTQMGKRWPIRATRALLVVAFFWNLISGIHALAVGHVYGVVSLIMLPAIVAVLAWQVRYLRRADTWRLRPRPDYASIARMEREVWGRAFDHDGAPDMTVAELKTRMDDLAERATARMRPCISCGSSEAHVGGRCPDCYQRAKRGREDHRPDATVPATVDQYAKWLRGYIKRGGKPTHFYDYPFGNAGFRYASTRLTIDSGYEFGARSRMIVVASGVPTQRTNPAGPFGGWGHTKLYFMHGYRTNDSIVPVYSDPEFDEFRTAR